MSLLETARRLWRAPARRQAPPSEDFVTYEGPIYLEPSDEYGAGNIVLASKTYLVDHFYDRMNVPSEDGLGMHVEIYGRITLEVLPEPDSAWWM